MGPFPEAQGRKKFLFMTIDYFTKWIEVEPVTTITEQAAWKFVWKNLIYRFGIPRVITSDNGK